MVNNTLTHFGIKGMKWGVRRTDDQLARDKGRIETASSMVKEAKNINNSVSNIRSTSKSKDLSKMSDAELRAQVNRMNLEQQYSQLSSSQTSKGQSYVKNILDVAGSTLAIAGSAVTIALGVRELKKAVS
jgi:hypothetical protein